MFAEKLQLVWERLSEIFSTLFAFFPALLIAMVVFAAGWLLARVLRLTVLRMFSLVGSRLGRKAKAAGLRVSSTEFAGLFAYWMVLFLTVILAFEVMGLSVGAGIAERLLGTVPRIFVALIIFFFGFLMALLVEGVARGLLERMGQAHPLLWSKTLRWGTLAVVALLAMEQLGLAAQFALWVVLILVGALALAVALAFGLGCRELARDLVVEFFRREETGAAHK